MLLKEVANSTNPRIINLLLDFLNLVEFGTTNHLEKHLKNAIINNNLKATRFLLRHGAKLEGSEWPEGSSAYLVLRQTNSCIQREMFLLLLNFHLNSQVKDKQGLNLLHRFLM